MNAITQQRYVSGLQTSENKIARTQPQPFVSKTDLQARASQTGIFNKVGGQGLQGRQITVNSLISREGMKAVLGRASKYGKVKDSMMRGVYKMTKLKSAETGFGSNHRGLVRLAGKYQELVGSNAPESERAKVLKELLDHLDLMHTKQAGTPQEQAVVDMIAFVKAERSTLPGEHLKTACEMLPAGYHDLKLGNPTTSDKIAFLETALDHFQSAQNGGVQISQHSQNLISQYSKELLSLKVETWAGKLEEVKTGDLPTASKVEVMKQGIDALVGELALSPDDNEAKDLLSQFHHDLAVAEFTLEIEQKSESILNRSHEVPSLKTPTVNGRPMGDKPNPQVPGNEVRDRPVLTREVSSETLREQMHAEERLHDRPVHLELKRNFVMNELAAFDRGDLKHVLPDQIKDRSGIPGMQKVFVQNSQDDRELALNPKPLAPGNRVQLQEVGLDSLSGSLIGSQVFKNLGTRLSQALEKGDQDQVDLCARQLGVLLGEDLGQCSKEVQVSFLIGEGSDLKTALLNKLAEQCGEGSPLSGSYSTCSGSVRDLLDLAVTTAMSKLPDHCVDDNHLVLDGVSYTKVRELGSGAYGSAAIYEGTKNGEPHRIVVKSPLGVVSEEEGITAEDLRKPFAKEIRSHYEATAVNNPNIVPFRGAVSTPDGRLLIAMDLAENGELGHLAEKVNLAFEKGQISRTAWNAIQITMLMDMANGLRHLQEQQGMTHLDIKPENYFVTSGGKVMLGDFGLAQSSPTREFNAPPLDSPINKAPEMTITHNQNLRDKEELKSQITTITIESRKLREEFDRLDSKNNPQRNTVESRNRKNEIANEFNLLQEQKKSLEQAKTEVDGRTFTVDVKADTWGLGTAAYKMFTGRFLVDDLAPDAGDFDTKRDEALERFGQDGTSRVRSTGMDDRGVTQGTSSIDRVLNQMLHPDPQQRPSMSDLLNMSLFKEPGVGSDAVRELIDLIAKGPPKEDPGILDTGLRLAKLDQDLYAYERRFSKIMDWIGE